MTILGIWDGHDAGAALLVDGRLVAAVNEERLSRRKLEIRFPAGAIHACLAIGGIRLEDVAVVAASTSDPAKTLGRLMPWTKERYYAVRRRKAPRGPFAYATQTAKKWVTEWGPNTISRRLSESVLRRQLRDIGFEKPDLHLYDHHHCHARTAAHASGFDTCAVVTIDGVGDGLSSTVSVFEAAGLRLCAASAARDSLGVFFEHVTQLLNMRELEDEGKVMALADYVAPVADAENPLLAFFEVSRGRITLKVPAHALGRDLKRILWTRPNEEFAFLAQRTIERISLDLVRSAVELTGLPRVALAGGVVSNVKANRLIRRMPEVKSLYVFPHMGDGGLALGAALAAAASVNEPVDLRLDTLALGPLFTDEEISRVLSHNKLSAHEPTDPASDVARRIMDGQIVCWFQGRMEYGPRALGNRSVLARPDRLDLKDRLNLVLKRRVWYQPFCPSVLETDAAHLFSDWTQDGCRNRHMTMAFLVAPEWRSLMAGATSTDGSCRPQLVPDDRSDPFARILQAIRSTLGIGAVLNTSFNIHGEPLVCSPAEAVDVFLRSRADALAIGRFVVQRPA